MMAEDAWAEVLRAIRNFGSYRETEALESLNPLTRKAVNAIRYKDLCLSENIDVIRGQFRMAYETLEKRETMDAKTPQALKDVIAGMDNRFLRLSGEDERKKAVKAEMGKEYLEIIRDEHEDEEGKH